MPKVLLVEDDNNLREIFQMRLQAEGFNTLTAADGEEGLVVAMKEKPELIIADVMMPKLSGFEMVENLRSAPETKDAKVIMMTALGQAEDQARGEKLGVVKYLVKSQVTLEDFARVVKEVLGPGNPNDVQASAQANITNTQESEASMQDPSQNPAPSNPAGDSAAPADTGMPAAPAGDGGMPSAPAADGGAQTTAQETSAVQDQINNFAASTDASAPASDPAAPSAPGTDTTAPAMPPASEPTAAPADPAAPGTDSPAPSGDAPVAPSDPTANAL